MDCYENDGIMGQIEYIDAPADIPTMLAHVEQNIRRIRTDSAKLQFILLKFTPPSEFPDIVVPSREDWFSIHARNKIGGANTWHTHQGGGDIFT